MRAIDTATKRNICRRHGPLLRKLLQERTTLATGARDICRGHGPLLRAWIAAAPAGRAKAIGSEQHDIELLLPVLLLGLEAN